VVLLQNLHIQAENLDRLRVKCTKCNMYQCYEKLLLFQVRRLVMSYIKLGNFLIRKLIALLLTVRNFDDVN
jgi:hypothetical protein